MHIGALLFPTDLSIRPDRLAAELEARGFESLWVTEHTHIPTSRRTPWPGGPQLPEEYRRTLDPFVALTAAGAVTERLRLAPASRSSPSTIRSCRPRPSPRSTTSRAVACCSASASAGTEDGWSTTASTRRSGETSAARTSSRCASCGPRTRRRSTASSSSFPPSWSWPKPVRQPHPPIIMGGAGGPVTFRHVVEYCDGWMPIHGRRSIADKLPDLRAAAEAAGRDSDDRARRVRLPRRSERRRRLRRAGFIRCVLTVPPTGEDDALACARPGCRPDRHARPVNVLGIDLAWGEGSVDRAPNETGVVAVDGSGRILDAGWTVGVDGDRGVDGDLGG